MGKFEVVSPFRDRDNFNKEYVPGSDVSHLDAAVLKSLEDRGIIKQERERAESEAGNNADPDKTADESKAPKAPKK